MHISAIAEPAVTIAPPKAGETATKPTTARAAEKAWARRTSAHAARAVRTAPSSAIAAGAVRNAAISALAAEDAISATTTYAATVMRRVICAAGSARAV